MLKAIFQLLIGIVIVVGIISFTLFSIADESTHPFKLLFDVIVVIGGCTLWAILLGIGCHLIETGWKFLCLIKRRQKRITRELLMDNKGE